MLKRDQIGDLNSPWNKALSNERVFVLLGRDEAAADALRFYANQLPLKDPRAQEAYECADKMVEEQAAIQNELAEESIKVSTRELLRKIVDASWAAAKGGEVPEQKVVDQIINTAITAKEKV